VQHAHQRFEQGMKNSGGIAATPDSRKSEHADKIVNAPLKALDLFDGMFRLCFHGEPRILGSRGGRGSAHGPTLAKLGQELLRGHKERIPLQNAADDDHGMRPHNVNHRVAAKLAKMVGANHGVVVATPYIVYPRFELYDVVNVRSMSHHPVHAAANATEREKPHSRFWFCFQWVQYLIHYLPKTRPFPTIFSRQR
jgi:hypothetical protein